MGWELTARDAQFFAKKKLGKKAGRYMTLESAILRGNVVKKKGRNATSAPIFNYPVNAVSKN